MNTVINKHRQMFDEGQSKNTETFAVDMLFNVVL